MPSESQLKSQMQAAIAKKKKEQQAKQIIKSEPNEIIVTPSVVKPAQPPPIEVASAPSSSPTATKSDSINKTDTIPPSVIFFGQTIRIKLHKKHIYFSVDDFLPLSKNPDYQNIFIDYINNPKTKETADKLIETLTFTNEDGSDMTAGATAANILTLMRELKFSLPGPLGRWVTQIEQKYT